MISYRWVQSQKVSLHNQHETEATNACTHSSQSLTMVYVCACAHTCNYYVHVHVQYTTREASFTCPLQLLYPMTDAESTRTCTKGSWFMLTGKGWTTTLDIPNHAQVDKVIVSSLAISSARAVKAKSYKQNVVALWRRLWLNLFLVKQAS